MKAKRLRRLALDPGLEHSPIDGVPVIIVQLEFHSQEHGIIKIAAVFLEAQLIALSDLLSSLSIEHFDLANPLADLAGAVA